jgi:protein import protein ZIM17
LKRSCLRQTSALMATALLTFYAVSVAAFTMPGTCMRAAAGLRSSGHPVAQLVRIPRNEDDPGDEEDDYKDVILQVSQVATPDGQPLSATGRSVASVQFMITKAMRLQLLALGYSREEVDRMEPPRARTIIDAGIASSKRPQKKPKAKRDRFELQFTCNVCNAPNSHSISWHAYTKGTVIATCPGCQSSHLIADHLSWIEDEFQTLEQYMASRGTPVRRLVTDGAGAQAASAAAMEFVEEEAPSVTNGTAPGTAPSVADLRRPWAGTRGDVERIDGISDDQARRIRDAVRERKRRNRIGQPAEGE